MRHFVLVRTQDVSGVSGTGVVAEGVVFDDGRVVMRWLTNGVHAIVIHKNVENLLKIHGHGGKTVLRWIDSEGDYKEAGNAR